MSSCGTTERCTATLLAWSAHYTHTHYCALFDDVQLLCLTRQAQDGNSRT